MDEYYRLDLNGFSSPSFVSARKSYYGTRRDIAGFIAAVEGDGTGDRGLSLSSRRCASVPPGTGRESALPTVKEPCC